jgi:hypothetical protein
MFSGEFTRRQCPESFHRVNQFALLKARQNRLKKNVAEEGENWFEETIR